jgi:hypothetical protein
MVSQSKPADRHSFAPRGTRSTKGVLVADSPEGWTVITQKGEAAARVLVNRAAHRLEDRLEYSRVCDSRARARPGRAHGGGGDALGGGHDRPGAAGGPASVIDPVRRLTHVTAEVAAENYERVEEVAASARRAR